MDLTTSHSSILSLLSSFDIDLPFCQGAWLPKHHAFLLTHFLVWIDCIFHWIFEKEINKNVFFLRSFMFEKVFTLSWHLTDAFIGNRILDWKSWFFINLVILLCSKSWNHFDFWLVVCDIFSLSLCLEVFFSPKCPTITWWLVWIYFQPFL